MKLQKVFLLLGLLSILILRLCNIYAQQPRLFSETIWVWSRSLTHIPTFSDSYVVYPALFQTILYICEWIFFLCGYFFGFFNSIIDFDTRRLDNLLMFIIFGRFIVILFSIGTIYMVYKIGNRLKKGNLGITAMFFLGLNYFYLRESRFLYYNIPATFFIMLGFLFILNIFLYGRSKDYVLTGLIIGLATALHYQGIFLLIPLLVAHFIKEGPGSFLKKVSSEKIWLCFSLILLTFIICTPYIIWQFNVFIERLCWNLKRLTHIDTAQMGASPKVNGYIDYGAMFFKYDMLISALALFGSLLCFKNRQGILMVSFPFFFYLCYGKAAEVHPEWIMPVLPFMALLSAYFLTYLVEKTPLTQPKKARLLFFASLIVVLPSIKNAIKSELLVYMPDVRSFTAKWVSLKIPKDVKLLGPDLKLIDDGPILRKNGTIFFTPDFNKQIMQDYKGPTIKISGNITLPNYTGGIIKVSLRSKNYHPGGPPDIALIDVYKPGAYFLLAPVGYGEAIIRASYWETDASGRPRRSSQYMSIKIGKSDIGNIDLNISPIEADDKF